MSPLLLAGKTCALSDLQQNGGELYCKGNYWMKSMFFEHTRVAHHIPRSAEISLKYFETSGLSDEYFLDLDDMFFKETNKSC